MDIDFKLEVPIDWKPLEAKIVEHSKYVMYEKTVEALSNIPYYEAKHLLSDLRSGHYKFGTRYPAKANMNEIITILVYDLVSEAVEEYLKTEMTAIRDDVVDKLSQRIAKRKGFCELKTPEDLNGVR